MNGFYFLTKDRDLKFDRVAVEPLSVRFWCVSDASTKKDFWHIVIEARALGLSEEETRANMAMWGLDEGNGIEFCKAAEIAAEKMDGSWLVGVARKRKQSEVPGPPVSKFEVGSTLVEALAELVKPGLLVSA